MVVRRLFHYADGLKHKGYRRSCKSCKKPNHDRTVHGNMCRFHAAHGKGAPKNVFCATHFSRKNPAVRKYCK